MEKNIEHFYIIIAHFLIFFCLFSLYIRMSWLSFFAELYIQVSGTGHSEKVLPQLHIPVM